MSERQANITLFNSKIAELEVPANDLLWDKIEAQLDALPSPQPGDTTLQQGAAKAVVAKVIVASLVITTIIAIAWFMLRQPKPNKNKPQKQETIQPITAPAIKQTPATPEKQKSNAHVDSSTQKVVPSADSARVNADNKNVSKDVAIQHKDSIADNTYLYKLPGNLQNSNPIILIPADTAKAKPAPALSQDDYYFDVQKKKKKKDQKN